MSLFHKIKLSSPCVCQKTQKMTFIAAGKHVGHKKGFSLEKRPLDSDSSTSWELWPHTSTSMVRSPSRELFLTVSVSNLWCTTAGNMFYLQPISVELK